MTGQWNCGSPGPSHQEGAPPSVSLHSERGSPPAAAPPSSTAAAEKILGLFVSTRATRSCGEPRDTSPWAWVRTRCRPCLPARLRIPTHGHRPFPTRASVAQAQSVCRACSASTKQVEGLCWAPWSTASRFALSTGSRSCVTSDSQVRHTHLTKDSKTLTPERRDGLLQALLRQDHIGRWRPADRQVGPYVLWRPRTFPQACSGATPTI